MKKLLALTTIATLSMSTLVFATSPQKPEETTTATAVAPSIIIDRNTLEEMVPVRTLAEEHGLEVDWVPETKTTILSNDEHTYSTTIGSTIYDINGRETILETPAKLIDGVTYVPSTFVKLVEGDIDGSFDFNNPDIDSGFSVDVKDSGYVDYTTLPAEIN